MRESDTRKIGAWPSKKLGLVLQTHYDNLQKSERPLVITKPNTDIGLDDFLAKMDQYRPRHVVGPWRPRDVAFTSGAAERIRAQMPPEWGVTTGVVAVGTNGAEQLEFVFWAGQQNYRPIVLLPDPARPWGFTLNQYSQHGVLTNRSWYHLLGGHTKGLDVTTFKGAFSVGPPMSTQQEESSLWRPALTPSS